MVRFIVACTMLFVTFVSIMLVERVVTQNSTAPNAFIQQLMHDSQVVDAQWTWREIYPERDTVERALRLIQNSGQDGVSQQLKLNKDQSRSSINWRTATTPRWNGSILAYDELPTPHVYAIVIRPPQNAMTLGDALLLYGTPLIHPNTSGNMRTLCFTRGACVSIDGVQQPTHLFLTDEVQSITYLPANLIERSPTEGKWQGLRRY